ncbi:hypothetical protein AB0L57_27260 [Nocardia sp. NPDC052254]|uniref:hypothetical protein n=1 Tax=Nocardia sp. NPDC052254 TaxID=3155681 RepID=UPI003420F30A
MAVHPLGPNPLADHTLPPPDHESAPTQQARRPMPQRHALTPPAGKIADIADLRARQRGQVARHLRPATEQSVVDHVVDRLDEEFRHHVRRGAIDAVVRRCIDDLAGTPRGALPELGERLARQRLLDAGLLRTPRDADGV